MSTVVLEVAMGVQVLNLLQQSKGGGLPSTAQMLEMRPTEFHLKPGQCGALTQDD